MAAGWNKTLSDRRPCFFVPSGIRLKTGRNFFVQSPALFQQAGTFFSGSGHLIINELN